MKLSILARLFVFALLAIPAASPALAVPLRAPADFEKLQPWLEAKDFNRIAWFLFDDPAQIKRYDLAAGAWLPAIPLPEPPTAFGFDSENLYVAYQGRVARGSLDGSGQTTLFTALAKVTDLAVYEGFLLTVTNGTIYCMNKTSGAAVSETYNWGSVQKITVAPGLGKLFAFAPGVSPAHLVSATLAKDGTLGQVEAREHPGSGPLPKKMYLYPDERRVTDETGYIFATSDLSTNNSFGAGFADLAFYANQPVIAQVDSILGYAADLSPLGRVTPAKPPLKISVDGDSIYSFFGVTQRKIYVEKIPTSRLNLNPAGSVVSPAAARYAPDQVLIGNGEIVYLLSRAHLSIFRWSVAARQYLPSIELKESPHAMAYSPETNRLYLSYWPVGGPASDTPCKITQIRLSESTQEIPFLTLERYAWGMAAAGQYLFTSEATYHTGLKLMVYTPEGNLVSQGITVSFSDDYVWNGANRKIYTIDNDMSWDYVRSLAINEAGALGETHTSTTIGNAHPVRVAPDGSVVVAGSGQVYDANTLAQEATLEAPVLDAAWLGSTLFTLQNTGAGFRLQKRDATYAIEAAIGIEGAPIRILPAAEGVLAITLLAGRPHFSIWDGDLSPVYQAPAFVSYLPTNGRPGCRGFFDDFSNPASGWPVGSSAEVSTAYVNGEYQVIGKRPGYIYLFQSPACLARDYAVEVEVYWANKRGLSYGLVFGILGEFDQFYMLDISADTQEFQLWRYDGEEFHRIRGNLAPEIREKNGKNGLKITRYYNPSGQADVITIEINRVRIEELLISNAWEYRMGVGLFSTAAVKGEAEARFDNFRMAAYPGFSYQGGAEILSRPIFKALRMP